MVQPRCASVPCALELWERREPVVQRAMASAGVRIGALLDGLQDVAACRRHGLVQRLTERQSINLSKLLSLDQPGAAPFRYADPEPRRARAKKADAVRLALGLV